MEATVSDGISAEMTWLGVLISLAGLSVLTTISHMRKRPPFASSPVHRNANALVESGSPPDGDAALSVGHPAERVSSPVFPKDYAAVVDFATGKGDDFRKALYAAKFSAFQRQFLTVFLLGTCTEWMKAPFTMAIYADYGFTLHTIAYFFACGFLFSVVIGTFAAAMSDSIGRVFMARAFCLVHAACLLTMLSRNGYVLGLGRGLGGIAGALLYTSFESWMVSQHHILGFNPDLLQDTFSKAAYLNSLVAVVSGLVAELAVAQLGLIGPFIVPLPALGVMLWLMRHWPENYGDKSIRYYETLVQGFREIRADTRLQLLGACEACFDAAMGIWVFTWTPALDTVSRRTPLGIVFVAYMISMMCGGVIGRLFPYTTLLPRAHELALVACAASAFFFTHKPLVFASFLVYEMSIGIYYVAHATLRSTLMKDASRSAVMSLFRVPLNVMVVVALVFNPNPQWSLSLITVLQLLSTLCLYCLLRLQRRRGTTRATAASSHLV